jgi:nucleotide-binding universal stress UspA family protein
MPLVQLFNSAVPLDVWQPCLPDEQTHGMRENGAEATLMYKKILVPVDGSDPANLGLNEAIQLARDQGGTIRVVHIVNELILLSADAYGANVASVLETLRKNGESILGEAEAAVCRAGVDVDAVLFEAMGDQAGAQIVQQANAWPADLIVCGTHGRRGIRRMVLGSDAEYVLRHTPVPVLLVRSRETATE